MIKQTNDLKFSGLEEEKNIKTIKSSKLFQRRKKIGIKKTVKPCEKYLVKVQ